MSLFVSLKEILNESVVEQIAKLNGEKPEKIQKAIDALGATVVGGLLKRITSEYGINLVFNQVQKSDLATHQLETTLKTASDFSDLSASGDKIFHAFLPSLKSPVSAMVARHSGVRNSLVSLLCGVVASGVLAALKKKVAEKNLQPDSLAAYLSDQREGLLEVAPDLNPLLIETLGLKPLLEKFAIAPVESASGAVRSADSKEVSQPFLMNEVADAEPTDWGPYLKWFGIAAVVVGVVAGGIYFWNQRSQDTTAADSETTTLAESEARTVKEPVAKDTIVAKKDTNTVAAANPMAAYLGDATAKVGKTFKFEKVDFEDNTLQLKPEAKQPVQDLATLLKAHPTAEVKLVLFANDAKLPMTNKMLAVKRVFALKQQLIDAGIGFVRIDVDGRGNGVNVKDSTNRNRTPLREIYVKFVKK